MTQTWQLSPLLGPQGMNLSRVRAIEPNEEGLRWWSEVRFRYRRCRCTKYGNGKLNKNSGKYWWKNSILQTLSKGFFLCMWKIISFNKWFITIVSNSSGSCSTGMTIQRTRAPRRLLGGPGSMKIWGPQWITMNLVLGWEGRFGNFCESQKKGVEKVGIGMIGVI